MSTCGIDSCVYILALAESRAEQDLLCVCVWLVGDEIFVFFSRVFFEREREREEKREDMREVGSWRTPLTHFLIYALFCIVYS